MADRVEISAEPPVVKLTAGDTVEVTARVRNLGQTIDQLTIAIDGLSPDWYTLPVSSVALFPNDQDDLRIIVHPPREAQNKPGNYPFRISVTSQENPDEIATAEATVEIGAVLDLELVISPESIAGRSGVYQVTVRNPGDSGVTVNLDAKDDSQKLRYRYDTNTLTVAGNGQSSANLKVKLGWLSLFGRGKQFDFQVAAAPPEEEGKAALNFCPFCGHQFQKIQEAAEDSTDRSGGRLQGGYARVSSFFSGDSIRFRQDRGATPIFCPICSQELRGDALAATGSFVRTPWSANLRRIRLRRIKFPRIRFPSLYRQPIIGTFRVTSTDKRQFTINWSVKRAREVTLDGEEVNPTGDMVVRPMQTTVYTLSATSRRKSVSRTIEANPLPLPQAKVSDRIKASFAPTEIQAYAGGAPVQTTLQLQNLGEIVDKFIVEIEGLDEPWCIRSASSVALMPQATDQVQLSFQPPKKEGVRAGIYPFAINIRSQTVQEDATTILGQLEILPAPEFKIEIRPMRVSCRRKGKFRVRLINTGVSDVALTLQVTDSEEGCKFRVRTDPPKVRAWSTVEVPMVVKPKRWSLVGPEKRYDVTVVATAADSSPQSMICELQHRPFFRSWRSILRIIRRIIIIAGIIILIYYMIQLGGGWSQLTSSPKMWWQELVNTVKGWF